MVRVLYEDVIGEAKRPNELSLSELALSASLKRGLIGFFGRDIHLSPPQVWAIEHGVTCENRHFLVSAPTNSGKTLIALLRIFEQAITSGRRSVYVVPLKALAEEKADEVSRLIECVVEHGGARLKVHVSTGDYQLSGDFLGSEPPDTGEIVICTPERLDVILRNPDNLEWARSVGTYILDEFHLLGEVGRGAVMESLVTRLLLQVPESSLVALSATIGGLDQIAGWLAHTGKQVQTLSSEFRFPALRRIVIETNEKNAFIIDRTKEVYHDNQGSLLVFVYRKHDAEQLVNELMGELPDRDAVAYFHAGLGLAERRETARRFREGVIRVLVATTSLKMGINTPANEVIVRDTVFHGSGRLGVVDLLQMLGRAGRGDSPGTGYILCSTEEGSAMYPEELRQGYVEPLRPRLLRKTDRKWGKGSGNYPDEIDPVKNVVLSEIARHGQLNLGALMEFLMHSFSGWSAGVADLDLTQELAFLERGKLIYPVENAESTYAITRLGRTTVFSGLSPESGAMVGGFLRALINLSQKHSGEDQGKNYLRRLRELDFLFLSAASYEVRGQLLRKPTKSDRNKIEEYIEALPVDDKPVVNLWRSPESNDFPTRRLLSSLRFTTDINEKDAEVLFYRLMETAVLLHRHAKGEKLDVLAREYGVYSGSLDTGLKYTVTWILSCLAQICTPNKCYKLEYLAMRIYELLEDLSLGSTLGRLLTIKGVGRKSVYKLLDAGFNDITSRRRFRRAYAY